MSQPGPTLRAMTVRLPRRDHVDSVDGHCTLPSIRSEEAGDTDVDYSKYTQCGCWTRSATGDWTSLPLEAKKESYLNQPGYGGACSSGMSARSLPSARSRALRKGSVDLVRVVHEVVPRRIVEQRRVLIRTM